jgi:hypothetical protein
MADEQQEIQGAQGAQLAIARRDSEGLQLASASLDIRKSVAIVNDVRTFIATALKKGTSEKDMGDYFRIPGTNKPTLLQPGAEKIALYLGLYPKQRTKVTHLADGHVVVAVHCELIHRMTGKVMGFGQGECSSRESKYAYVYVPTEKKPSDSEAAKLKALGLGRFREIGGRYFWCERVDNPNIWDTHHTVRLMADKRAYVHAVRRVAALSEQFSQDFEDYIDADVIRDTKRPATQAPKRKSESQGSAAQSKAEPSQEGEHLPVQGSVEFMVEAVTLPSQEGKPCWVKAQDDEVQYSTFDKKDFPRLQQLVGQKIGVDYKEGKSASGRVYRNIQNWWTVSEPAADGKSDATE